MRFSEEVCLRLGNYVYRLIDPRNGETFYVGKGRNNRVFDHAEGLPDISEDDSQTLGSKLDHIRAIRNAGLQVLHVIHRHEIPDEAVFEVEAALIDAFPGLTNVQGGHASSDRGPMNHLELIDKYSLPQFPLDPPHSLILINVNKLEDRFDKRAIYNLVRYCWRISKPRAEKADYVLAVVRGVVVGVFKPLKWMNATSENFPEIPYADGSEAHRIGFVGVEAPSDVWDFYAGARGKQIVQRELRHVQYPIRYWNC
ncbi:hypothetical protein NOI24_16365 [Neorhizobium galegae]|uniref:LEM-3-like GIY-YIG domain-containing protein n=1 Tax=Neorhizobium galegae TaxID=399 RepID=UPI002104CF99|nr:hypothetical protein [Neorhizobium galegae]MCQ1772885.1 hypothetical protein [Neorhizobium galegae]MCQ1799168.1 hypothetical protein [Neorhizobium galegae]